MRPKVPRWLFFMATLRDKSTFDYHYRPLKTLFSQIPSANWAVCLLFQVLQFNEAFKSGRFELHWSLREVIKTTSSQFRVHLVLGEITRLRHNSLGSYWHYRFVVVTRWQCIVNTQMFTNLRQIRHFERHHWPFKRFKLVEKDLRHKCHLHRKHHLCWAVKSVTISVSSSKVMAGFRILLLVDDMYCIW